MTERKLSKRQRQALDKNELILKLSHKEVFAKHNYTVVELRLRKILLFLSLQKYNIDTYVGRVEIDKKDRKHVFIPLSILLGASKSHNTDFIKQAIDSFNTKTVWYDDENGNSFKAFPFIAVYIGAQKGIVELVIDGEIWNSFSLEATHYSNIDLMESLCFNSALTMRLYDIANDIEKPTIFNTKYLKDRFCMENKRNDHFIRDIISCANKLHKSSINLKIEKIITGTEHSITSLRFTPIYNAEQSLREYDIKQRLQKNGLNSLITEEERYALIDAGFTNKGICSNIVTIKICQGIATKYYGSNGFTGLIHILSEKSKSKNNPQGWIINEFLRYIKSFQNLPEKS